MHISSDFFRILEKTSSELICTRLYLLNIQERLLGMDSEILKDLLVHSDFNNLTCHQHKEIFGNQSHYYSCRPEDPEFYDCHPEILWKDINVSLFVNIYLSRHLNACKIFKVHICILRRPQNFAKSSPYFCSM